MRAKYYQFQAQLAEGQAHERHLDDVFAKWFAIKPATAAQQRLGIDRIFRHRDGSVYQVEYKADSLAGKTGNAFVETISVDTTGKPGWAITSQATTLVYMVTEPETVYVIPMVRIRTLLPRWQAVYRTTTAQNDGYQTHGVLVPLAEFEKISILTL